MKRQAEEGPAELKDQVEQEEIALAVVVQPNTEPAVVAAEESKDAAPLWQATYDAKNAEAAAIAVKNSKRHHQFLGKKIRIAILTGYNGVNFFGSQKNESVRTVEAEVEKSLHEVGMIADMNFGNLQKIGWSRATRTDKKVHALINTFSAKVLINNKPTILVKAAEEGSEAVYKDCSLEEHLDDLRNKLNTESLPSDVKIFSMLPVANRFNAKNCTSYREYSYFLPTFMLKSLKELYLLTPPRQTTDEEKKEENTKQTVIRQISGGVKKITRAVGVQDEHEEGMMTTNLRNIDHISAETIDQMYKTRLSDEQKTQLHEIWGSFKGTKKYHNFTKEIKCHEQAAMRYMMKMTANEFMYVNRDTLKVTEESDPQAIEFVRFYLQG